MRRNIIRNMKEKEVGPHNLAKETRGLINVVDSDLNKTGHFAYKNAIPAIRANAWRIGA